MRVADRLRDLASSQNGIDMCESRFLRVLVSMTAGVMMAGCAALPEPPAPIELQATGSLRSMHLRWTGGAEATAYDVYRSSNDSPFVRINASPVVATSYDDPIESPAGDGVRYRYRVAVVGKPASEASNIAGGMHGTRLAASYPEGFSTRPEDSPYVVEQGTTMIDGDLWVAPDTRLYVTDGAIIDFRGAGHRILVDGTLRAVGSAASPAAFTAHRRDGGYLADGEGFQFVFEGPPYAPDDPSGSGSLLDHVEITQLAPISTSDHRGPLTVIRSGVALQHVKARVNVTWSIADTHGVLVLTDGSWIVVRHSLLEDLLLRISTDLRDTPFEFTNNVVRGSDYSILFQEVASPAVRPGQIDSNDLDGARPALLLGVTGTAAFPVGNNYWGGGTGGYAQPPLPAVWVQQSTGTATVDFQDPSAPLVAAPAGAGPDW